MMGLVGGGRGGTEVKAFVVSVNGKKLCTAGVGPDGVLQTSVVWVGGGPIRTAEGKFSFHVGGLDARTEEHVDWETPQLAVGDVVTVEIIEAEQVDPEALRHRPFSHRRRFPRTGARVRRGRWTSKKHPLE